MVMRMFKYRSSGPSADVTLKYFMKCCFRRKYTSRHLVNSSTSSMTTTKSIHRLLPRKLDTADHRTNRNDTPPTETTSVDKTVRIPRRVKHVVCIMLEVLIGVDFVDQSSTTTAISGNEYYSTTRSTGQQTLDYKSSLHDKRHKIE